MDRRDDLQGHVVQLDPSIHADMWGGCFVVVDKVHPWGITGYIPVPRRGHDKPGLAYIRAPWSDFEYVGSAQWVTKP